MTTEDMKKTIKDYARELQTKPRLETATRRPREKEEEFMESDKYFSRTLQLPVGETLSYQRHYHRKQCWIVLEGVAKIRVQEEEFFLQPGESLSVPPATFYQLENPGKIPLDVLGVAVGEYLEEDDVEYA